MDGLRWISRHGSLALSPRVRLVDEVEADALRRKREQLQWRPRNGFLLDEVRAHTTKTEHAGRTS